MTASWLAPDLRRIRADNPSALTGSGTNTYLLGRGAVALIDPGPDLDAHLAAIEAALAADERITAILVTHGHLDHSALAPRLAARTGAPVIGAGRAHSGRSAIMQDLALRGLASGAEGFDPEHDPDLVAADGQILSFGALRIEVLATPGHTGCHLAFSHQDRLFSGDHVMGWSTSLISPPDGDMADYMRSLQSLCRRTWRRAFPGHGEPIDQPARRIDELIRHRQMREREVLSNLGPVWTTIPHLTRLIYRDTPAHLWPAAERNMLAHLIKLWQEGQIEAEVFPDSGGRFRRTISPDNSPEAPLRPPNPLL